MKKRRGRDYSEKVYEIQLKYGEEWRTMERPSAFVADHVWHQFIRRYRSFQVRMVSDGRVIRRRA
jgi:hypothetical protein